MANSWLLGGLTGLAVLGAATAIPFAHRGAGTTGAAAAATTGNTVAAADVAARMHPSYRVPVGSPIPNPSPMPGHLRPYAGANNGGPAGARMNGAPLR
jgi:hypothetical protein